MSISQQHCPVGVWSYFTGRETEKERDQVTCPQPFCSSIDDLGCNSAPSVPQFPHLYPQRGFTDVKAQGMMISSVVRRGRGGTERWSLLGHQLRRGRAGIRTQPGFLGDVGYRRLTQKLPGRNGRSSWTRALSEYHSHGAAIQSSHLLRVGEQGTLSPIRGCVSTSGVLCQGRNG